MNFARYRRPDGSTLSSWIENGGLAANQIGPRHAEGNLGVLRCHRSPEGDTGRVFAAAKPPRKKETAGTGTPAVAYRHYLPEEPPVVIRLICGYTMSEWFSHQDTSRNADNPQRFAKVWRGTFGRSATPGEGAPLTPVRQDLALRSNRRQHPPTRRLEVRWNRTIPQQLPG